MSNSNDEKVKSRRAALARLGLVVGTLYTAPSMVGLATAQADDWSRPSRSRPSRSRFSRWSRPSRPERRYYSKYDRRDKYSRPSRYSRYSRVSRPWFYIRF